MRRALVSVTDKRNLEQFKRLTDTGNWDIVTTGGTALKLKELDIPYTLIEDVTGFPEMLDGRLKTLHPKIFGGILARRSNSEHLAALANHGIVPIDIVAVNLYDFAGKPGIEQIDIGGPSLLRAAAKNFIDVTVLSNPADYAMIISEILEDGHTDSRTRFDLAKKVFTTTECYDADIAGWMRRITDELLSTLEFGGSPH